MSSPPQRRRNPLLSSYFDQQQDGDRRANSDINGPNFDANAWFATVLAQRNLEELVTIDNQLTAAVKKLDNGMKTLVYENYNKFISATDTIRDMQSNVGQMEAEMEQLKEEIERIDQVCERVNDTLGERRAKVDQLSAVHRLLKGRQFLFDLPGRLRMDLKKGEYADAVHNFQMSEPVFAKYSDMSSFRDLYEECAATIDEIKGVLWDTLSAGGSLEEVASAASLLKTLKEDHARVDSLFEAHATKEYDARLKHWQDTTYDEEGSSNQQMTVSAVVSALSTYVLPLAQSLLRHHSPESFAYYLVEGYRAHMLVSVSEADEPQDVLAGLHVMQRYLTELGAPYDHLHLEDKAKSIVTSTCISYCQQELLKMQQTTEETVAKSEDALQATDVISGAISSFLDVIKAFAESQPTTVTYGSVQIAGMLSRVAKESLGELTVSPPRPLFLSALFRTLSLRTVSMAREGIAGLSAAAGIEPEFDVKGPTDDLQDASLLLMQRYAVLSSRHMGKLISRSLAAANWLTVDREPQEPRLAVTLITQEFVACLDALSPVLGDGVAKEISKTDERNVLQRSGYLRKDSSRLLYQECVQIFGKSKMTKDSIFATISRAFLKEFSEAARHYTFNTKALHQLQVDVAFIGEFLRLNIKGKMESVEIENLLKRVISSISDRCTKVELLQDSVIQSILNKGKK